MRLEARTALYCHEFLHKTYAPNRFDLTYRIDVDPVVDEFKNLGIAHEAKTKEVFLSLGLRIKDIDIRQSDHEWQKETAETLLSDKFDIIFGANISDITETYLVPHLKNAHHDESRVSRPDILVRIGTNTLGNPSWAPIDIKSHGSFTSNKSNTIFITPIKNISTVGENPQEGRHSEEDLYQLAHYTCHLRSLGIATDELWVGIIGRDNATCAWAKLDTVIFGQGKNSTSALSDYLKDFARAEKIVSDSLLQNRDANHYVDSLAMMQPGKFGCQTCEYRDVCRAEMKSFGNGEGHVTLLATVTPKEAEKHFSHISTIKQLLNETQLDEFGLKSQIRARVWNTKIPELINPNEPLDLPEFDIEIDIDLENSQALLMDVFSETGVGKDLCYLYGYGIWDKSKSPHWRDATFDSFSNYSDTDDGEYEVLSKMWMLLNDEVVAAHKANKSIGIFHYSSHERTWWKKYAERHAGKPHVPDINDVIDFCDKYLVDLYKYTPKISFPTISYSIKNLAGPANFQWSVQDPGGGMSLVKYKLAINPETEKSVKEEVIDWLYRYNLDDVRATFAVREYIRSIFAK